MAFFLFAFFVLCESKEFAMPKAKKKRENTKIQSTQITFIVHQADVTR